jgi:hypothetical protein
MRKRMSPRKFYFLYYQMTELIPLFSYLERLQSFQREFKSLEEGDKEPKGESKMVKMVRNRSTAGSGEGIEEMKEPATIKGEYMIKETA